MGWIARLAAVFVVLAAGMGSAQAPETRIALVIGNAAYVTQGWALKNPVNDARLIAGSLQPLGFDVTLVENADEKQLEAAVNTFGARLRAAGKEAVGFFYYAGHGVEHDGANLLIPVDVSAGTVDELRTQAVPLSFVLRDMSRAENGVNFVVLDACRNLPLPSPYRSGPYGGLAPANAPNVLIAYATRPGMVAYDNPDEGNSVFTKTLATAFSENPSERVVNLFSQVQSRVNMTRAEQTPEFRNGLLRNPDFRFREPPPIQIVFPPPSAGPPKPPLKHPTTPGEVFKDCETCPEMVVIPPGRSYRGAGANESGPTDRTERILNPIAQERPQRLVTIARPFAMSTHEVTVGDWERCVSARGTEHRCRDIDNGFSEERLQRPITNVRLEDAQEYIAWLNETVGGSYYRLPTEAEWEYAARGLPDGGPNAPPYPWGVAASHEFANYGKEDRGGRAQGRDKWVSAAPVGQFPANAFKLFDMHGNVAELVQDCMGSYENAPTDGSENRVAECHYRIARGGAYNDGPYAIRSSYRDRVSTTGPYVRTGWVGFRLARTIAVTAPAAP